MKTEIFQYLFALIIAHLIAAYRDVDKQRHKIWAIHNIMDQFKYSLEEARAYFNTHYYEYMPKYYSHSEGWHLQTTAIWITFLIATSIITMDWRYLIFIPLSFPQEDASYYLFKKFINPEKTFFPDELEWFLDPVKIFGINFNFLMLFHKKFTRVHFICWWIGLVVLCLTVIYLTL